MSEQAKQELPSVQPKKPGNRQLRWGIKTAQQNTTYEDMLRVWLEADSVTSIEHAWAFDHFIRLGPDPTGPQWAGWTLLGALAAQTRRLRAGLMANGTLYRHPTVLARTGATLAIISHAPHPSA